MMRLKTGLGILLAIFLASTIHANTTLISLDGQRIPFDSLRGKWVFINYWASWCPPCLEEIAELNKFYKEKKNNAVVFAVNFDYLSVEEQLVLVKKLNIRYPSLETDPAQALGLPHVQGVPVTFVFNPAGKLSTTLYGGQNLVSLNEAIIG